MFRTTLIAATLSIAFASAQAAQPLQVKVYNADGNSFNVNSTLVYGEKDAMVIDAGFTRADALRIAANVLDSGKELKTIYVSQADPDYYFGVETLKEIFPTAEVVTTPAVLAKINAKLAGKIEASISASDYRFSAAHAYYAIVERRINELRESRIPGMQPFREFMERRLTPAMDTCGSVARRQKMLAERIDRASDLLRTRVDITREKQNQQLLEQMNKRSQLQLRLQETVEGLSVAAITYYTVGLIGYGAKSLKSVGIHLNPELVMGLSIPLIAGSVWLSMRSMRKGMAREMGGH